MRFFERWRHFVFDDLDFGFIANDFVAGFDRAGATNIETHRGVKLQRITTSGGLGIAKHDANLHADLVNEDDHRISTIDRACEFTQGLRHQPRLQTRQ